MDCDLILTNASILPLDASRPRAEALAVKNDRIIQIGAHSEIIKAKGTGTRLIDCGHKTVIPGFNDAHCHIFSMMRKVLSLDLSPSAVHSINDILQLLHKKASCTPPGTWISGVDYNEFYLAEKRHPNRRDLDAFTPANPVILSHRSMHACVLNSLALKMTGITIESEEPPGAIIDRFLDSGEPSGVLFNMTGYVHDRIKQALSQPEIEWAASQVNTLLLSSGITCLGDAAVTNDMNRYNFFTDLKSREILKSRVRMMPGQLALEDFRSKGLISGKGEENLKIGPLKIVLNFSGDHVSPGQQDLNQLLLQASKAGFQVAVHAVEKECIEAAVSAFEFVIEQNGSIPRPRIEHCSECPPELIQRIKKAGVMVVSQPSFIYYSGERYLAEVPPSRQKWLYPFKSLIDAGVIIAGSSDSPVVSPNPLTGIYAAVTRRADSGQSVLPSEAVSPQQALAMYTLNAAYSTGDEQLMGSLSPGKLADMVILSENPLDTPAESLKEIKVEATFIGGKPFWGKC